jgi:hypothetical protein
MFNPSLFTAILGIFSAVLGFYITHVVEELRSGYTAIYEFETNENSDEVLFHLDNISRSKRIEAASFVIKCKDQRENCFKPLDEKTADGVTFVRGVTTAPNFGRPIDSSLSGPASIQVCLGAIALSRTSLKFRPEDGARSDLIALYDPWSENCGATKDDASNLLLLRTFDPHAFLTKHYFVAATWALVGSTLWLLLTGFFFLNTYKREEVKDEPDQIH